MTEFSFLGELSLKASLLSYNKLQACIQISLPSFSQQLMDKTKYILFFFHNPFQSDMRHNMEELVIILLLPYILRFLNIALLLPQCLHLCTEGSTWSYEKC